MGAHDAGSTASSRAWMPPSGPPPGDTIAGYTDLREVARGGDGIVYRARQHAPARDVAIKVLAVDDPATQRRFQRELELTVRLGREHPNIVTVLDTATTASGRPCLVMDFVESGSLEDRLRNEGSLPVADVLAIGTVVADALAFAHERGVLHRDVKPANILVLPTSYVLSDFGVARAIDGDHTDTAERFSYRHAAPQVLDGEPPSAADDVWSVGSTLHTLLEGWPPYAAEDPGDDTALAYLRRVRLDQRRAPVRAAVPEQLRAIVGACLSHDPGRRPTAAQLRDALRRVPTEGAGWAPGAASAHPASEPPPDPAPAPAPLAASAAAALPAAPPEPETGPVGPRTHPPQDPQPSERSSDQPGERPGERAGDRAGPAEPDAAGRRPRRTLLIVCALALVVGGTLGVVGHLLRDGDDAGTEPGTTPGTAAGSTPVGGEVPVAPDAPDPTGPVLPDPDLVVELVDLRGGAGRISLTWSEPVAEGATFVVVRVDGGREDALRTVSGSTSVELDGFTRDERRVCFRVAAFVGSETGVSRQRCGDPWADPA